MPRIHMWLRMTRIMAMPFATSMYSILPNCLVLMELSFMESGTVYSIINAVGKVTLHHQEVVKKMQICSIRLSSATTRLKDRKLNHCGFLTCLQHL